MHSEEGALVMFFRVAVAITAVLVIYLLVYGPAESAPPRPEQPRPDLFSCGVQTCDAFNPVTIKARAQRTASYRLKLEPGCVAGTIPADMVRLEAEAQKVQFNLVRNDQLYDFIVRINCGSEQIRLCGSVNVYCLNRGYPYSADVDISDVLSSYFDVSRLSILLHEIIGHAIGSWNEQYATCGSSCGFAASPGWRDFMNTGPDSRHGIEAIELERWERTMYPLAQVPPPPPPCGLGPVDHSWGGVWNSCIGRWIAPNGFSVEPGTWTWFNPQGQPEWTPANADRLRWNIQLGAWFSCDHGFFIPSRGYWSHAPSC